jgi:hypothetical protein
MLDNDSYMQLMNYNQFVYFEIVAKSPYLMSLKQKGPAAE